MLRALVALLLAANLAMWAYTQGHLAAVGLAPHSNREPERLARQLAPEKLTVLRPEPAPATAASADAAPAPDPTAPTATDSDTATDPAPANAASLPTSTASAAPPAPVTPAPGTARVATSCWQASGLSANQTVLLRAALQGYAGLPGNWSLTETVLPARWIVYLGKFANADALQARRAELRQAQIDHREVRTASLQPGLALGTYSSEAAARRALADASRQGVRNARVVQEREESRQYTLTLPAITDAQQRQITAMDVLAGQALQRCP